MNCPLCQSSKNILFHTDKSRDYFRCNDCSLVFVPDNFILTEELEKAEYDKHDNRVDDLGYRKFLSRIFFPIKERLPKKSAGLDFGCGPGPALAAMFSESGFKMSTYDPFYADDSSALSKAYDFITCTEVIEHVKNPHELLPKLLSLLKNSGTLGIMTKLVINEEAFKNWHYKNDPTHIRFYSRETFEYIAKKFSIKLEIIGKDVILLTKKAKKRKVCQNCERPQKVCLCDSLVKINNSHTVCILRHKSEKKHALNTVKILAKCLTKIDVFDGENFDEHPGFQQFLEQNKHKQLFLLYPDDKSAPLDEISSKTEKEVAFIVLDGTWRKTRAIKRLTRKLDNIPSVSLKIDEKSKYTLRKGPEGGVSTLEAVAMLLTKLECNSEKYTPLYTVFQKMIDLQISEMGQETFQKNYRQ